MSITKLTDARRFRQFLTYDLEWIPGTLEIRLVGVFDGKQYRSYTSLEGFIASELTHKNRGKWFYAHAGGLADFQFVLEQLAKESGYTYTDVGAITLLNKFTKQGYKIKGSFSGSSAIIVHVTKGKNSWHFVDSYWLLRDTLRNIGKWVGISKGNVDECVKFYAEASLAELREYNELDCVILYKAIDAFEVVLLSLGGQLKMTQASCAMELFRRRFLKRDIDTSNYVNEIARNSYFASRVEVFMKECHDALYYDINSSFPYSMTHAVPGELIGCFRGRIPDIGLYMADCTVEVPDTYMPPLPIRKAGRIFFPIGKWRGWYTNVDLQLLQDQGGKILQVHSSMAFETCMDLSHYANTLFDLRKVAADDSFEKLAYKYLLNSLYGKFAESAFKSGFVMNPSTPYQDRPGWTMLFPGAFLFEQEVPIPHMHVPISTHITSIARRTIYKYMSLSPQVHYCDTDGFSTDAPYNVVGPDLGAIKLEKYIRHGNFYQAKVYMLDGTDMKGKELLESKKEKCGWCGEQHEDAVAGVKAKGFSRMTVSKLEKLARGEEIEYTRMRRIKELLRSGDIRPRESVIRKRLNQDAISKRFFYPDGQSRPWNVGELEEMFPE